MMKQIEIKCKGAGAISIDLLTPLQGNLKYLTEANYKRLRTELEIDGFIEPISVWESTDAKVYILNGHQRFEAMTRNNKARTIIHFVFSCEGLKLYRLTE